MVTYFIKTEYMELHFLITLVMWVSHVKLESKVTNKLGTSNYDLTTRYFELKIWRLFKCLRCADLKQASFGRVHV